MLSVDVNVMIAWFQIKGEHVIAFLKKQQCNSNILIFKTLFVQVSIKVTQVEYKAFLTFTVSHNWQGATYSWFIIHFTNTPID